VNFTLTVGAPAWASDGPVGHLKYIVVDPQDNVVTDFIVEHGHLFLRDIVVPVGWVAQADEHGVVLNANRTELASIPEFRELEFRAPDPTAAPVWGHPPAETRVWVSPYLGTENPGQPEVVQHVRLGGDPGEVLVRRGIPVTSEDGQPVGTVDHVLVDPATRRLTHIVFHRGAWLAHGDDVMVPAELVAEVGETGVRLKVPSSETDHFTAAWLLSG
jgi:uncharacterized protein YrrD